MRRSDPEQAVRLLRLECVGDVGVREVPGRAEGSRVVHGEEQHTRQRTRCEAQQLTRAPQRRIRGDDHRDHRRLVLEEERGAPEQAGAERALSPGEQECPEAERPGRNVAEVRRGERRRERAEPEGDERRPAVAGRDPFADPADEEHAGEERDPAREEPHAPDPQRLVGPALGRAEPQDLRSRELQERHAGCLVRVEVAPVARPVERRGEAGVVRDATVRDRLGQAEP